MSVPPSGETAAWSDDPTHGDAKRIAWFVPGVCALPRCDMPTDSDPLLIKLLTAWNTAVSNPTEVLEVLYAAASPSAGQTALQERFGWDEIQASSVLNMQFRRVTRSERDNFARDQRDLEAP